MSSSVYSSAILLTDKPADVKKKVNSYAKSGGQETAELQRKLGADLEVDVPYQYLTFFLDDDEKLEDIKQKYSKGELLTGEVKAILIDVINKFLKDF